MSRHKKVRALDYDEEYDDYYGDFDDDDDFDDDAFEKKYLSSGIDLETCETNDSKSNKKRQTIIDKILSIPETSQNFILVNRTESDNPKPGDGYSPDLNNEFTSDSLDLKDPNLDSITSGLAELATEYWDKHQWQLPLLEMDNKFRNKTYYEHYRDAKTCLTLDSKLGNFLSDSELSAVENLEPSSRVNVILSEYYQSIEHGSFSPKRLSKEETFAKAKKQVPPKPQVPKKDDQVTARFEYQGKASNVKKQPSGSQQATDDKQNNAKTQSRNANRPAKDLTIQENFTAEQLDELSKQYNESLKLIEARKSPNKPTSRFSTKQNLSATATTTKPTKQVIQAPVAKKHEDKPKQKSLATLAEKRATLKQHLKRQAEPTQQDRDTFKRQALKTTQEYEQLMKGSRPRINLVVVGHVDAGKSTLVGHLLYKLGQVSGKQMHRNEVDSQRSGKASFKFAWALDETAEERARGVTIDIALTKFETDHKDIVILDAPGHVDFIPAVISGAAQADAALLVVDATRGEFETGFSAGGQTREHTFLVRSLGVKSLVVVVNKMDNISWNAARFADITDQLKPFLKQVGFNIDKDVQFVACSGLSGENLVDRRIAKVSKLSSHPQLEDSIDWTNALSLVEAIDRINPPVRMVDKPTRVCVTDVYKGMSSGVFLGAKVAAGKIEAKQKLILLPPNETCEVKQVEVRESKENKAFAGDIVTATVMGIEMNKFFRGCVMCDPLIPCKVTNRFEARVIMLDSANTILIKGTPIEVHINGTFESGEVRRLKSLLNRNSGELIQKKPRCLAKNSSGIIQLRLSRVVCCELYEDDKNLGRFMIRCYGKTVAAGLITRIKSPKLDKSSTKFKSK